MTTVEIKTRDGAYSISVSNDDMNIDDVFHVLIVPLLLSAGYHHNSISDCLKDNRQ